MESVASVHSRRSHKEERPHTIDTALQGGHDLALEQLVQETAPSVLYAWRGTEGTTLMQEVARRGYHSIVELLLSHGTQEQLQEEPDPDGNYSAHLAAKNGYISTAAALAKGIPGEVHTKANHEGAGALALALVSLRDEDYGPRLQSSLEALLSLCSSESLSWDLATCRVHDKSLWEHLMEAMWSQWVTVVLTHIKGRAEWKEILCRPDEEGRNVAHFIMCRLTPWYCGISRPRFIVPDALPPSLAEVLDLIPEEALMMEDFHGKRAWQYAAHCRAPSLMRLAMVLSRTPVGGLFAADEPLEAQLEQSRQVLRCALRNVTHDNNVCDMLRTVLSRLPRGTANASLLEACDTGSVSKIPSVLAEFMTEKGFLEVTHEGKSFVHIVIGSIHRLRSYPARQVAEADSLLHLVRDIAYQSVDCQRLLSIRCNSGLTAADLAESHGLEELARELRLTGVKAAVSSAPPL